MDGGFRSTVAAGSVSGEPDKHFSRRAFLLLFLILAAQTMTETARDALFLSRLAATRLPWMYILVAIASIFVARAATGFSAILQRALLPWMLLASAVISGVLWLAAGSRSPVFLYPLYLWPGVFSSVVIVEFWRAVSDAYTITEAKKVFARLGAGGNAGAAAGSGLAVALTAWLPPSTLLLVAGVLMTAAIGFSPRFAPPRTESGAASPRQDGLRLFKVIASNRYLRGVTAFLFLATVAATLFDFTFKGIVTRDLSARDLGRVFASVSLAVNIGAMLLQATVVSRLIQRLGVTRSIAVLPSVVSVVSLGLVAGAGFIVAIVARLADGTIRYSLHRATSDLLYVPLTPALRAQTKSLLDVLSQRGGQIAASALILLVLSLGGGYRALATGVVLLGIATVAIAFRLAQPYLDLFRATLKKAGTETRLAYPTLDIESLISLVAAFSGDDERAVVAAMDLVAEEHGVRAIPVVMLFHPSRAVVMRALTLFERHRREGFAWAVDRLRHDADDPRIRAAALTAYARQRGDIGVLRAALDDRDEVVRVTALVAVIALGGMTAAVAAQSLADAVHDASTTGKEALLSAVASQPSPLFDVTLLHLADSPETSVRLLVAEAMARMPSPRFMPALRSMLSEHALRPAASRALAALGAPGLTFLAASLETDALPRAIRLQLPQAICEFRAGEPLPLLWQRLVVEPDELIRFKLLRAIGRLAASEPQARPDAEAIARAIHFVSQAGLKIAIWRLALERGAPGNAKGDAGAMLIRLLSDKQARAVEAIFRLLALSRPSEDFAGIYRGLRGTRAERASGRELLESVVPPPARAVVLALLDDAADPACLLALSPQLSPKGLTHDEAIAAIERDSTGALHDLAARCAVKRSVLTN